MPRQRVPPERQLPPDVEVAGFVVVGYLQSATDASQTFADRFEEQLATRGVTDPETGEWYSAPALQEVLFETRAAVGEEVLIDAGAEMARLFDWPDSVSTTRDVLSEMTASHEAAHRNVGDADIGSYRVREVEDGRAVIDCAEFPYPDPVARGAIRGAVELISDDPDAVTVSERQSDDRPADGPATDDSVTSDSMPPRFVVSR